MVSLKNLWQQQREQRQQEMIQRHVDVREQLSQLYQQRSANAHEMQRSLADFQRNLQHQTQTYLHTLSSQRYQHAQALVTSLQAFSQQLHEQTQQFLDDISTDRYLRAEALFRDLEQFHSSLSQSVAELRSNLHAEIQQLKEDVQTGRAETQLYLSSVQQKRLQEQVELANALSAYVQEMQANVGLYLDQLNQMDQARAEALVKEFQVHRQHRAESMQALFQELAVFRGDLRDYCRDLHSFVWGDGLTTAEVTEATTGHSVASKSDASPTPFQPVIVQVPQASPSVAKPTPAPVSVSTAPSAIQSSVSPVAAVVSAPSVAPEEKPEVVLEPVDSDDRSANGNGNQSAARTWNEVPSTVPSVRENVSDIEGEIVEYLQAVDGARLIEIEHALDINRFQTVDALRSLIKQGRVIQRDRVYLVQSK